MKTYHTLANGFAIDLTGAAGLSPARPTLSFTVGTAAHATMLAEIGLAFNPPMRAAPTFSVSSVGDFFIRHVLSQTDTTGLAVGIAATFEVVGLLATVAAGLTAGQAGHLTFDATANAYIQFSAEL